MPFAASRLRRSAALMLFAMAGIAGASSAAQAQFFGYRSYYQPPVVLEELTPREVFRIVRSQGFRDPSRLTYRDDVVLVTAAAPSGRTVRLVLDVYSGRIIDATTVPQQRVEPPKQRPQLTQRAPDQGPAIRRTVPDSEQRVREAPEPAPSIKREPPLPRPAQPSQIEKQRSGPPQPQAQPPQAGGVGSGTRTAPRRIDVVPPVDLDATPVAPRPPSPPAPMVPPAALE
jgi:hypothetical protein